MDKIGLMLNVGLYEFFKKFNFLKIRELLNCKANQLMKKLILAFIYFVPFVITAQNANKSLKHSAVKLVDFEGKYSNYQIDLNWTTVNEINNVGFEIERSTNNQIFNKIGFVKGIENSVSTQNYSFTDEINNMNTIGLYTDKLFYRLKQLGFDGNYHFTNTISVSAPDLFYVSFYPNPFSTQLTINVNSNFQNQNCNVKIFEITGLLKIENSFTIYSNHSSLNISDVNNLNPGIYFVIVLIGEKKYTFKAIKI